MSNPEKIDDESKTPKKNVGNSKKKPRQVRLSDLSKIKGGAFSKGTAYSLSSLRDKIVKSINWNESEWPELPKLDSNSSQVESRPGEKSPPPSTSSASEYVFKGSEKIEHEDGVREENPGGMVCSKVQHKCDFVFSLPKTLDGKCSDGVEAVPTSLCTYKKLEAVTCNFSALNVSNDCHQIHVDQATAKEPTQPGICSQSLQIQGVVQAKKSVSLQRQLSFKNKTKDGSFKHENPAGTWPCHNSDQILVCDDHFPHLLSHNKARKEIQLCLFQKEDPLVAGKKVIRKYPRKDDPICINLGQVLENVSGSSKDGRIVARSRYLNEVRPASTKTDTSRRVIKRGKQREFPKRKVLSKLKLAILRGRQQRQQMRQLDNTKSFNRCENINDLCFTESFNILSSTTHSSDVGALKDSREVNCGSVQEDACLSTNENDLPTSSSSFLKKANLEKNVEFPVLKEKPEELGGIELKLTQLMRHYLNPVPCTSEVLLEAKSSIHSRKFREYCSNDVSTLLEEKVKSFVKQIYRYQTKSHFRDAEKARIHRRYALGLREADKFLKLRKLKVLIIATDMEVSLEKGGLDEMIENIKSRASKENLPVVFSLKRRDLAYCVYRKVPVSCMAVLNYEGAEELYRGMIEEWREASLSYERRLKEKIELISHQNQQRECPIDSSLTTTLESSAGNTEKISEEGDDNQLQLIRSNSSSDTSQDQSDTD